MLDWTDDLPSSWHIRRLDEVASIIDSLHKTPVYAENGYAMVRVKDVSNNYLDLSGTLSVTQEVYEEFTRRYKPQRGDIVFSRVGTYGNASYVSSELQFCLGQNTAVINPQIDGRFLHFFLRSPLAKQQIEGSVVGSTQKTISLKSINAFRVPVPPRAELLAISSLLAALDDKIELNRRMNETLEAMARAPFRDWFVDFGPTRAKMEARAPYLSPDLWSLFPDRLDAEGKPEGWEERPVGDFAELKGGKQLEKEHIADSGPVPVFGGAGLMGYTANHNADGFVISVGRVGAYCGQFFSHRGKAWINNNASLIRPNAGVSGEWLLIAVRHIDMNVIKKGAAQPFVSNGDIAKVGIMWPGPAIISAFSEVLVSLMRKAEANERESRTLAQTRDLLLPRLMSGELRVAEAERLVDEVV
jgi:type I restriction enzyme, S subunit